ncbi:ABF-2 [Trichostrongylus colubriformis]|uniref:ABF-2 n=1 Tax=Trichostrongylus colubriformis TaxID=6319 RepID=A0AAN8ITZ8_TRICO
MFNGLFSTVSTTLSDTMHTLKALQKMNRLVLCLLVAIAFADVAMGWSCDQMNRHPVRARVLCIGSCNLQSCATGYCQIRRGRKTCVCSRCSRG